MTGNPRRGPKGERAGFQFIDLRHLGTVPHTGFGLGFDELTLFLTCGKNIRDVVP